MFRALYVVLLSPREGCKVEAAVVADPVVAGVLFVSLESSVVSEGSVTAITICHQVKVVAQSKEWKWDDRRGDSISNLYDSSRCSFMT